MSRRRIHSDLRLALGIRRLQEQAALLQLQAQRRTTQGAQERVNQSVLRQQRCEADWGEVVGRAVLETGTLQLWQIAADSAVARVALERHQLEAETEALAGRRTEWDRQLRLADSLTELAHRAARALHRAEDERRLCAAEDGRISIRGRE